MASFASFLLPRTKDFTCWAGINFTHLNSNCYVKKRLVTCNVTGYTHAVVLSFKHKGLERFFESGSKSGIQPNHAARLQLILGRLNASVTPEDMDLPGLFLHPLTGNRKGAWSVRVSGNWRVAFKFTGPHAEVVDYEDYH